MENTKTSIWNPAIVEETCNGTGIIPLESRHLTDRKLFINGVVTSTLADNMVSEFLYLATSDEPVDIYINTPGGSVVDGMVIYDLIQTAPFEINMYCTGMAASMGAVLLAGGPKGHRFILPHSKVMIHEPLIDGSMGGSATSIKKTADSIMETKRILVDVLSKHTGKTKKAIDKAISFDNYMNAEEAVEFGICDEIRGVF